MQFIKCPALVKNNYYHFDFMKITMFFLVFLFVLGCSNTSKSSNKSNPSISPVLEVENNSTKISDYNNLQANRIKYNEDRTIEKNNPPVTIDLEKITNNKEIDFSRNFSQVKYIKLRHPLVEKGIGFLTNANYHISYERRGSRGGTGLHSEVYLSPNHIVIGDPYFGYYCYDQTGKYLSTIAVMDDYPTYDAQKNELTMIQKSSLKMISHFSVFDNYVSFIITQGDEPRMSFFDLTTQQNFYSLNFNASRGDVRLLNSNNFVYFNYIPTNILKKTFMHTFDIKGDTVCQFLNYNSLPLLSNNGRTAANLEASSLYYSSNILTIKQAYNDTIFRMPAENRLVPTYVLNWGSKKIDVETALYGDASGRWILNTWHENRDFIYMVFTEDVDNQINRKSNKVKFNYAYFDKKEQQIYGLNYKGYPEELILSNNVKNGIPVYACRLKAYMDKLYAGYTKSQLKSMMELDGFSKFPADQQKRITSFYNELDDNEMILMILE